MITVTLKAGRDKPVRQRHPWGFSGAIDRVDGSIERGGACTVHAKSGELLGEGYFNPDSSIAVRMTVFGKGTQTRSFCYVSDLIEGIYRLMMSDYDLPVNIAPPPANKVNGAKVYSGAAAVQAVLPNAPINFNSFLGALVNVQNASQSGGVYLNDVTVAAWQIVFQPDGTFTAQTCQGAGGQDVAAADRYQGRRRARQFL